MPTNTKFEQYYLSLPPQPALIMQHHVADYANSPLSLVSAMHTNSDANRQIIIARCIVPMQPVRSSSASQVTISLYLAPVTLLKALTKDWKARV